MKAIELLKLYREGLLIRHSKIEIRKNNNLQKVVMYGNNESLENEPLLNEEIDNWFIGSDVTEGGIVIDLKDDKVVE